MKCTEIKGWLKYNGFNFLNVMSEGYTHTIILKLGKSLCWHHAENIWLLGAMVTFVQETTCIPVCGTLKGSDWGITTSLVVIPQW